MKTFKTIKKAVAMVTVLMFSLMLLSVSTALAAELPSYSQKFDTADDGTQEGRYSVDTAWELNANNDSSNTVTVNNGALQIKKGGAACSASYWMYTTPYKGEVEIMFDVTWKAITGKTWQGGWFNVTDKNWKTFVHIGSGHEYTCMGNSLNEDYIINEINVGTTYRYKLLLDMENKSWTVSHTEVVGGAEQGYTQLDNTGSWDTESEIYLVQFMGLSEYSVDNFSIRQTKAIPTNIAFVSDDIDEKDVSLNPIFNLNFSEELINADAITLHKGDESGEAVWLTSEVIGTVVKLSTNEALKPKTKYTLVLPNTLVSNTGGVFAGESISFYTCDGNVASGAADFNDIGSDANVLDIISYLKGKGIELNYYPAKGYIADEETYNSYKDYIKDTNKIEITEGGELHIIGDFSANSEGSYLKFWPMNPTRLSSKYMKFDFDIKADFGSGWLKPFMAFNAGPPNYGAAARFDVESQFFLHESYNGSGWTHGDGNTYQEPTEWVSYSLLLDYDNSKWYVSQNGGDAKECAMNPENIGFLEVFMTITNANLQKNEIWIDNLSIEEIKKPEITVADNEISSKEIVARFNTAMNEADIKLYDATGTSEILAVGKWSTDGYKYTITPAAPLDYNTDYMLKLPDMTSVDGIEVAAYDFKVATKPVTIEKTVTDGDGNAIDKIEAGKAIKASSAFVDVNGEEGDEVLLAVSLYDRNGKMIGISAKSTQLSSEGKATSDVLSLTTPSDLGEGAYLKFFAWNLTGEPIVDAVRFSAE